MNPGLAALVELPPGLHVLRSGTGVDTLAAEAGRLGHRLLAASIDTATDKAGLVAAVHVAIDAPPWAGHGWDALSDLLRDLSWLDDRPRILLLDGCELPATMASDAWCTLLDVCREAVGRWALTATPLRVALRASDPRPDR